MVRVTGLTKYYPGALRPAVRDVSFSLQPGEMLCIVGKSGCGKTTVLKTINRMIAPTTGIIEVNGKNILDHDPVTLRRSIGNVIQQGGLFPHWTVERNIGLVPNLLKWDPSQIKSKTEELLHMMDMPARQFLQKYPHELSGGEVQRVSLARALAADPDTILLDEPFSALDPFTRKQLQDTFSAIKERLNKIMIFVTHDLGEAFKLADKLLILDNGMTQQLDTPENILQNPANTMVRSLLKYLQP